MSSGEQMTCPLCAGEMIRGRVLSNGLRMLSWLPDGKKVSIWGEGKTEIGEWGGFFRESYLEAFVCAKCKKLVADLQPYLPTKG